MKIQYRKKHNKAKTWFAEFPIKDKPKVVKQLTDWLLEIGEASVQGTDKDRELWRDATLPDKELWRRSQEHGNQPNTMISVLSGAIEKLLRPGELTEKQLENVQNIALIMAHHTNTTPWTFEEVKSFAPTGSAIQDLQNRLFEIT